MDRFFPRSFVLVACVLPIAFAGCTNENDKANAAAPSQADAPPAKVGVITLHPQSVPISDTVPGRTAASAVSEIRPQVSGIVQKRVFKEGSEVKAGDVLYEIDARPYQAAVDSAKADLAKAQAVLANAKSQYDRYRSLGSSKVVSAQDIESARATAAQAEAGVSAANAALETAQINLGNTRVTAPISGLIGTSSVTQGALVTANQTDAMAVIRQIDPIYVDMTAASGKLLRVRQMLDKQGQQAGKEPPKIHITLEDGTVFDQVGEIMSTEAKVDEGTDTVSVRASMANPNRILLPGMYVRANVDLGSEQNVFLLPQRAVSRNAKGQATAVFVTADNKTETKLLEAYRSYGNDWVVRDGITDGDRLVVDGLQKLRGPSTVDPVAVELDDQGLVKKPKDASADKTASAAE